MSETKDQDNISLYANNRSIIIINLPPPAKNSVDAPAYLKLGFKGIYCKFSQIEFAVCVHEDLTNIY